MIKTSELTDKLRKCVECSCSRCTKSGTTDCYVEIAIRELNRYEQAFDAFKTFEEYVKGE